MFDAVFILILVIFGVSVVIKIAQWAHNNSQPQISNDARVTEKRRRTHHNNQDGHIHIDKSYHITFACENGQEVKVTVRPRDFDAVAEGDRGVLTMQGTRFISFVPQASGK